MMKPKSLAETNNNLVNSKQIQYDSNQKDIVLDKKNDCLNLVRSLNKIYPAINSSYVNGAESKISIYNNNLSYSINKILSENGYDANHFTSNLTNNIAIKQHKFTNNQCITNLFWQCVHEHPNDIAVYYHDEALTYCELSEKSSDLAIYLEYLKVSLDDIVGIFQEPTNELMIGVYGILCSGGAYLPLAPEYPDERLKFMIEDSRTKIIITQEKLKDRLLELVPPSVQLITLNDVKKFKESYLKTRHYESRSDLRPNNLAYVIYTSGSTGKPKAVMVEHHSIVNQMLWLKNTFHLNNQCILQKTPLSFDAAQWEVLALCCGSKVVMGTPGIYKNPEQIIKNILKYNVTLLQCVPTLLQALIDNEEFHRCKVLKWIFSGGEILSKKLAQECIKAMPHCKLVNLYGPTECTINSSAFLVDPLDIEKCPNSIPIGKPIDNIQYYVLNDKQLPVKFGETGELYIGGEGLARGYLHQPKLTAEKFINNPFCTTGKYSKLYKTGDLAYWNPDGTLQYVCRVDNQVKLRGFRIELDEIKSAIETHDWVKNSAVIVQDDRYTGYQNLIAFIELNSTEATLMDQGNHDAHHQSKESRIQVKMQLSNKGCREEKELCGKYVLDLPGKIPTEKQTKKVFARKTYRFYEGNPIKQADIINLLYNENNNNYFRKIENINYENLAQILRYFGQFSSEERVLPKYGYASPGALYATQIYLELNNIGHLPSGYYYYHPVYHQLILINAKESSPFSEIKLHFIGKKSAIEPIYKNNILEVLEIEAGHILGLFDKVLSEFGLSIEKNEYLPSTKKYFEVADEDFYLGAFQIISGRKQQEDDSVEIYVQIHPGKIVDLKAGLYLYKGNKLEKISNDIILKKHVIAVNQEVYDRSSFGIILTNNNNLDWLSYINLGRKLQHLQMNDLSIGFMSSGYSSKTGNDLPSAKRIKDILGRNITSSYFFIGGGISDAQINSHGMQEDAVHMRGPAEMIKDELVNFLPDYMMPNKVIVLDKIPLTVNGKIDIKELKSKYGEFSSREYIAPRTDVEQNICDLWESEIKKKNISIKDNFFELGGNSLIALNLINKINKKLESSLSVQVLFESPTIEKLALQVHKRNRIPSRLIPLQQKGSKNPIYCWPGLGGYCMNLRLLAEKMGEKQPFYGLQAYGINVNETPYTTIKKMAAEDIKMIKKVQPVGPYTLWGYSFGCKVAFEVAYQLEQSGDVVENLYLIAPGSPFLPRNKVLSFDNRSIFSNKTYLAILFSVFMGSIAHSDLDECLQNAINEKSFINFIIKRRSNLEPELIKRIIDIVSITYGFKYSINELNDMLISAPITIFKANGDDYSFIENSNVIHKKNCSIFELKSDHYNLLKNPNVQELVEIINAVKNSCFYPSDKKYQSKHEVMVL